jgi:hypothetical protein
MRLWLVLPVLAKALTALRPYIIEQILFSNEMAE